MDELCSVLGCAKPPRRAGLCSTHSTRFYRWGDVTTNRYPGRGGDFIRSFYARINKTETCWFWTGALNSSGYGSINIAGRTKETHRLSYELHTGPIAPGMVIDHLCRARNCVNPAHLEMVTKTENAKRSAVTHCRRGHEYTEENTFWTKGGSKRECKACRVIVRAERRAESKANQLR